MRITVFTTTYNRAYTLTNLYESLRQQTFHDFEWLIIDDGSDDDTEDLVGCWMKEDHPFEIRYYRFDNAGKQKEINRGLNLAEGELFFNVDSDDTVVPDALALIDRWEKDLPKDGTFCGVAGNSAYADGHFDSPLFEKGYQDSTLFARLPEMCTDCQHIGFDRAWVFYTKVHRKYLYPEFENEKFIPEAVVWNRMANKGLQIRSFNDIICSFTQLSDGYTSRISQTLIRNPHGYGLWKAEQMTFLHYSFFRRIREYYVFYCDLTGSHTVREISGYIHCPVLLMKCISLIYKVRHRRTA